MRLSFALRWLSSSRSHAVAAGALLLLAGCSDPELGDDADGADTEIGATHAILSVERTDGVGTGEASLPTQGEARAGFVQVPGNVDAAVALRVVKLRRQLPEVGTCATVDPDSELSETGLSPVEGVELLPAEGVWLVARPSAEVADRGSPDGAEAGGPEPLVAGDAPVKLAPHAFPGVTDLVSGVLYTSRDRSTLPAGTEYRFFVTGDATGSFEVDETAPAAPTSVTLDERPIADVATLDGRRGTVVRWEPGASGDVVYVQFAGGAESLLCSFDDALGSGVVPSSLFQGEGDGTLSVHRVHEGRFTGGSIADGEVRFDFAVARRVQFR